MLQLQELKSKILTRQPSLVWYASYGSNMNAERFACYIVGGTPKGGARTYHGCTNKSMPLADMAVELPRVLYFAGESKVWTGGRAFITHTPGAVPTKGRAYLIRLDQFEQIVAQESHRPIAAPINLAALRKQGRMTLDDGGAYDELLYCGEQDAYPIVSFTSPHEKQPYTKPAEAYLRMIGSGLMEAHRMTMEEVAIYLSTKPGIAGQYTAQQLIEVLASES